MQQYFKKITTFAVPFILNIILFVSCTNYSQKMTVYKNEGYEYDDSKDIDCFMYFEPNKIEKYSDIDDSHIPEYLEKLNEIVYNKPIIRIVYTYNFQIDPIKWDTGYFELKADNNKNFTRRELMYKINNEVFHIYCDKDVVLEGLTFKETQSNGVDLYELGIGS